MKRTIGFVLLIHDNPFRARQLVRYLSQSGAPVALHFDQKMSRGIVEALKYDFSNLKNVYFAKSISCGWGEWSIVQATLNTTKELIRQEPALHYIYHLSGSCLPIRRIDEMRSVLGAEPYPTDFIEAVDLEQRQWVQSGLGRERVEYTFPFNFQEQKKKFEVWLKLQSVLKLRRRPPEDLKIHLGSQWWCISRITMEKILDDDRLPNYVDFFRRTWIPDESFFQTLVKKHGRRIHPGSLTYSNFDHQGKPFIFYEDHLLMLKQLDRFFIRKVWKGSTALYSYFLNRAQSVSKRSIDTEVNLKLHIDQVIEKTTKGRVGLISQARIPKSVKKIETRSQYFALIGGNDMRDSMAKQIPTSNDMVFEGRIFHPNGIESSNPITKNLEISKSNLHIRDYAPSQFLTQLIWGKHPSKVVFVARPHDVKKSLSSMLKDPNANILIIRGAWIVAHSSRGLSNIDRLTAISRIELRREEQMMAKINCLSNRLARVEVLNLGDIINDPSLIGKFMNEPKISPTLQTSIEEIKHFVDQLKRVKLPLGDYSLDQIGSLAAEEISNVVELRNFIAK